MTISVIQKQKNVFDTVSDIGNFAFAVSLVSCSAAVIARYVLPKLNITTVHNISVEIVSQNMFRVSRTAFFIASSAIVSLIPREVYCML